MRTLIFSHRWLGVFACLLFAMWFGSGIVMLYVPFPRLTEAERLQGAAVLDPGAVRIGIAQALAAAGEHAFPREARLAMLLDRPVYRWLDAQGRWKTVDAGTGAVVEGVDEARAIAVAQAFARSSGIDANASQVERLHDDQWTVPQGLDAHRPLFKVSLGDAAATVLYVSSRTGEVVRDTTGRERFWNWVGSVPHWIYPTVLRAHAEAWRQVILWVSGAAIVSALTGVVLGIWRMRWRPAARGGVRSPYRGWMKWHHWLGLCCSLFIVTWMISGWLSVNPASMFSTANVPGDAQAAFAATGDAARFELTPAQAWSALPPMQATMPVREIELRFVLGRPWFIARGAQGTSFALSASGGSASSLKALPALQAFPAAALASAAQRLDPAHRVVDWTLLEHYDTYYRDRRALRVLPVLRVRFDDPVSTWYHIDPATGRVLERMDRSRRAYRWWFNGLHSLDLPWLYGRRPLWDIVVIGLSLGGLAASITGVVLGWRSLKPRRTARRNAVRSRAPGQNRRWGQNGSRQP